jgi:peptidoglycan/LPS O-acetylase OafA/YrhL
VDLDPDRRDRYRLRNLLIHRGLERDWAFWRTHRADVAHTGALAAQVKTGAQAAVPRGSGKGHGNRARQAPHSTKSWWSPIQFVSAPRRPRTDDFAIHRITKPTSRHTGTMMGDRLSSRDNALNFLRLILAGLVIVSHTWPIGGFAKDPQLGDLTLGSWAVAGFFVISGYLIAGSRMRLGLGQFAIRRGLRIYPGLWVCLVVVAFVFAPLTALGTGVPVDLSLAARFVWSNATTVLHHQVIGRELNGVPYPGAWDGPLWTLQHELTCYALMGLVLCWGWARRDVTRTMVAVLTAITALNVATAQVGLVRGPMVVDFLRLASYFAAGSLLWSLSDKIRVNRWAVLGSIGALVVFASAGVVDLFGALPLAYLVLVFGVWCPIRWGASRDLSYGVYIYAFPVQQVLALVGVQRFGPLVFILAAVALVLPLAWLSWTFVERPSLRLVRRPARVKAETFADVVAPTDTFRAL